MGKFRVVRRTEGISTTDILGKILGLNKSANDNRKQINNFYTTNRRIAQFGSPFSERQGRVVYVRGAFDIFHSGVLLKCTTPPA